ncbi:polysaccharide pyruvyl transferase family protein [Candidatus Micrarchaeota archaeon]|nr:polysaccharide pyruvyl transferase family protein [Candidatus Micrarchaeota archaeon]
MREVRFFVVGVRSGMNLGIMGIVTSSIRQLLTICDGEFSIITLTREFDERLYAKSLPGIPIELIGIDTVRGPYIFRVFAHIIKAIPEFQRADIILDMSGEVPAKAFPARMFELSLARIFRKPVVIVAQTFYEQTNPLLKFCEKFILSKVSLLIVREQISYNYLKTLSSNKVHLTADPAFLLPKCSQERLNEIIDSENLPKDSKIVGISPTLGALTRSPSLLESIRTICNYVINDLDMHIVFVPHVVGPVSNDIDGIEEILKKVKNSDKIHVLANEYTPEEIKGVIGMTHIYISMRMHAAIASVSNCIPTILILNYHKAKMLSRFGLSDYIFDEKQSESTYLNAVKNLLQHHDIMKLELTRSITDAQKESLQTFEIIQKFLDGED